MDPQTHDMLRRLPQVDAVLRDPQVQPLIAAYSRERVAVELRALLDAERDRILGNGAGTEPCSPADLLAALRSRLADQSRPSLRRVINATGIALHTNLGRAPLAEEALRAVADVGGGYSNLEFDLETGVRGSRYAHVEGMLCRLTGAESALVVNNNAAAVMLAVNTLAKDGEVVTSRGELVEIGGSFRIPEVIEGSEADMVEVGTTNKTRAADFAAAITGRTRILLRVHPSNYAIVGFTEAPTRSEIAALAHDRGLVAMEDLGSGSLVDLTRFGLPHEPTAQEALEAGMDLVTFSGDKLLGGPQAGILVGRRDLIERMKTNPLLRALRIDKLSLAALDATLRLYLNLDDLGQCLPVLRMLTTTPEVLKDRAERCCTALNGIASVHAETRTGEAYAGGGALPDKAIPAYLVAVTVEGLTAESLRSRLLHADPPVVSRIQEHSVALDLRPVAEAEMDALIEAVRRSVS